MILWNTVILVNTIAILVVANLTSCIVQKQKFLLLYATPMKYCENRNDF